MKLLLSVYAKNLLIMLLPLVILFANFLYLLYNEPFYHSLYKQTGVYSNFQDKTLVDKSTQNLIGYFKGENDLDTTFFSEQAQQHLFDVKQLIQLTTRLFYIVLAVFIALTGFLIWKRQYKRILDAILTSSLLAIGFFVFLAIGGSFFFDWLFEKFHRVVFANNLWLFPSDDSLVQLFPGQFFASFVSRLFLQIVLTSTVLLVMNLISRRLLRQR